MPSCRRSSAASRDASIIVMAVVEIGFGQFGHQLAKNLRHFVPEFSEVTSGILVHGAQFGLAQRPEKRVQSLDSDFVIDVWHVDFGIVLVSGVYPNRMVTRDDARLPEQTVVQTVHRLHRKLSRAP